MARETVECAIRFSVERDLFVATIRVEKGDVFEKVVRDMFDAGDAFLRENFGILPVTMIVSFV